MVVGMMESALVYRLETLGSVSGGQPRYAVLGKPVAHSRSPLMQEAALRALGLPGSYVRVECGEEQLGEVVERLRALGFAGWNCTIPLKGAMLKLVDEATGAARRAQAVNTVRVAGERLVGTSTDGEGWARAVREVFGVEVRDLRILILGAGGGSGQTLAAEAAQRGCERLVLVNRTVERARAVAARLSEWFHRPVVSGPTAALEVVPWESRALKEALATVDLIVNASSVGLRAGEESPLEEGLIEPHHLVYDLVYGEEETPLVRAARAAGARAADGLGMLLHQGAAAFTFWTGREAPIEVMREALRSRR